MRRRQEGDTQGAWMGNRREHPSRLVEDSGEGTPGSPGIGRQRPSLYAHSRLLIKIVHRQGGW